MNSGFGWCFIGAGSIVKRVMPEMHKTNGGYLASIYSPTFSHAEGIANQYGAKACRSAEEALSDPNVRAAYIATPHSDHMDPTLLALKMGLPVICEKPFAVNLVQARLMVNEARARKLFLMEGMWTRTNPVFAEVLKWITDGNIGRVRSFTANVTGRFGFDPSIRLFDYKKAGGMLLDVGVYLVAVSQFIFGDKPDRIAAMGELADNGADIMCAILLGYKDGISRLFTSSVASGGGDAVIYGEKGDVYISSFAAPTEARLITDSGKEVKSTARLAYSDEGFKYEFDAAMDDIRESRLENVHITHAYTLEVMGILDSIRGQIGLQYPADNKERL